MVAPLGPQTDAGAVVEPQTPAFGLSGWHLEPLASPDSLDPLVVHQPARLPQQGGDLAIALTAMLSGQFNDVGGQPLLIVKAPRQFTLGRAVLSERPAGATLGHRQHRPDMVDAGSATRRA